jgi:DNA helicase-2/ATP-dependent DNA helicase PcrA
MNQNSSLNPQQSEAVHHQSGPLLVLAGAGSGKTRIVTERIAHLLRLGVRASSILAVTFTNKAAEEMRKRVHNLCDQQVLACTFHSLGARILREWIHLLGFSPHFTIYDEEDSQTLIKQCLEELEMGKEKPKVFRSLISDAKNRLLAPQEIPVSARSSEQERSLPKVYALYQMRLKEYQALDFDDLLFHCVRLLKENLEVRNALQQRWSYLLIDEYQDINQAQYLLANLLVEKSHNLFVVGDPDQSIYSWRGADIHNILNFEKDYPAAKVVRLEQNYRSTNQILLAANALISHNTGRYEKNLWSELGDGEPIHIKRLEDEQAEAEFIASRIANYHRKEGIDLNEIVIFYRTNAQSRQFEDALLRLRIPYLIVGGISFYQRREIKDILGLLRMVHSGTDFLSFERTINCPKRGIGAASIDKMRLGALDQGLSILDFSRKVMTQQVDFRLSQKQLQGLRSYVELIDKLRLVQKESPLFDLVHQAIHLCGYLEFLKEDPESFQDRKENLDSLVSKAAEWEGISSESSLGSFLEELSLKSTLDEAQGELSRVHLMTLHNGKGLEFQITFIAGMEEQLLPHINCIHSTEAIEEERRLCYVGMTRAKNVLYLTSSAFRFFWGQAQRMAPSRFLRELPKKTLSQGKDPFAALPSFEEEALPSQELFHLGDEVFHRDFGKGTIERCSENTLGLVYQIRFHRDDSLRSLVAKMAHLSRK